MVNCPATCVLQRRYDTNTGSFVATQASSSGAAWTGGQFTVVADTSSGALPQGGIFDLIGDDIRLEDVIVSKFSGGAAMRLRGSRIAVIRPMIANALTISTDHGLWLAGGDRFRCVDGSVAVGGDAIRLVPSSADREITDAAVLGTAARSAAGCAVLIETEHGRIGKVRLEGIAGTGGAGANVVRVHNVARTSNANPISDIAVRDCDFTCGSAGSPGLGVLLQNGCTAATGTFGQLLFNNVAVHRSGGAALTVSGNATNPVDGLLWNAGVVDAIDPENTTASCISLANLSNGLFKALRLEAAKASVAVVVGDGAACRSVVFEDSRLIGVQSGNKGVTFDYATSCGWMRGAVAGATTATTFAAAFTDHSQACFVESADLSAIGADPTKMGVVTGITYRLAYNRGSKQRTPVGLGQRATATLNTTTHALPVASSFVAIESAGSSSSTQDLTAITGGQDGDLLVLTRAQGFPKVKVIAGTSTIHLSSTFFTLDHPADTLMLLNRNGEWFETARSDNG